MALSKQKLVGALEKKILTLDEKITFLEYAEGNKTLGCPKLAEVFTIGKTAGAKILKNKKKIREHCKFHEKNQKHDRSGRHKIFNDILYNWYQKIATRLVLCSKKRL